MRNISDSGPRPDVVGHLLEGDALAVEGGRQQARALAVDRQRAGEPGILPSHGRPDHRQRGAGQDVTAVRSLVAEDAVVQQRVGAPVVQAEQGRSAVAAPRAPGLLK